MPDSSMTIIRLLLQFVQDPNNPAVLQNIAQQAATAGVTREQVTGMMQSIGLSSEESERLANSMGMVKSQATAINQQTTEITENVKQTGTAVTGIMGYTLVRVGHQLEQIGKAITSPWDQFVKQAGNTDPVAMHYLAMTRELAYQTERIGKDMGSIIVPAEEKAAQLVGQLADFIDAHPEVAKAAVVTAGALTLLGGIAVGLGMIMNIMAAIRISGKVFGPMLEGLGGALASTSATTAAGTAMGETAILEGGTPLVAGLAATLGPLIAPIAIAVGGIAAVILGGDALANFFKIQKSTTLAGELVAMLAGVGGGLALGVQSTFQGKGFAPGWEKGLQEATNGIAQWLGIIPKVTTAVNTATASLGRYGDALDKSQQKQQILTAYEQYEKDLTAARAKDIKDAQAAVQDSQKAMDDITTKYNADLTDMVAKFIETTNAAVAAENLKVGRQLRDFQETSAQDEADYEDQRLKAARDANAQALKDEIAFQLKEKRLTEDHNDRMLSLAANLDALGMVQEQRAYDKQRRRDEEDYNLQVAQQHQALAVQLADMASAFQKERDRKLAKFQQDQKDEAADFAADQAQKKAEELKREQDLKDQYTADTKANHDALQTKLAAINQQYLDTFDTLKQSLTDRINVLDPFIMNTEDEVAAHTELVFTDLVKWLDLNAHPFTAPVVLPQALGGSYLVSKPTLFLAGEAGDEYAMFRPKRDVTERLGYHSMANAFAAMGGSSKQLQLTDQRRFYGGVSNAERRAINNDTMETLKAVLG